MVCVKKSCLILVTLRRSTFFSGWKVLPLLATNPGFIPLFLMLLVPLPSPQGPPPPQTPAVFCLRVLPNLWTSLVAQMVKRLSTMQEIRVQSLGREDPLEKEMAIHSSTIAWKIPWTEEPGRLQPMGLQRVGHDWATSLTYLLTGTC